MLAARDGAAFVLTSAAVKEDKRHLVIARTFLQRLAALLALLAAFTQQQPCETMLYYIIPNTNA